MENVYTKGASYCSACWRHMRLKPLANCQGGRRHAAGGREQVPAWPIACLKTSAPNTAPTHQGYAPGMKTAVSIPDDVCEKVERFARRSKRSRSEVFSAALEEYIARHAPDEVTDAINRAVDEIGDQSDEFVAAASRRVLEKTEW